MRRLLVMAAVVVLLSTRPSAVLGQVRIVSEEPNYVALAAAAAPKLAEIESSFRSRRVTIEAEAAKGPVTAGEVKELLDWVEGQMLTALEPDELAPLRASIQLRFERLQRQLAVASGERGGFAFASFRAVRASSGGLLSLDEIFPLLNTAAAVLSRLRTHARESAFSLHLCVVSQPRAGAMFRMRPPGYPPGVKEGSTVLNREVGRGRFVYLAEERKGKNREIECGWEGDGGDRECLDLWETSGDQLYSCNFDEGACTLRDLHPGGCPGS